MLRLLSAFVTGVVILVYVFFFYHFSVNIPFQDDFLLIQFVEPFSRGAMDIGDFFFELFRSFNDHKPVVARLIAFTEYLIHGHLNFRFYIGLVSLNIIIILYFLYTQFKKSGLAFFYFLPVPFLFLQPLYLDVSGWALTGMQHSFLTVFLMGAISFASVRKPYAFWISIVCCFLATFSHGNGIFSFPALIFFYLCHKDFRKVVFTSAWMILALMSYLWGYEAGQGNFISLKLDALIKFQLGFIGSSMAVWSDSVLLSCIFGAIVMAFMGYLTAQIAGNYFHGKFVIKPGTAELLSVFCFIFITSVIISVVRSWAGVVIPSRFQLYASLSVVIAYILALSYTGFFRRLLVLRVVLVGSFIYWGYSYYRFTDTMARRRATYIADVYNWHYNRNMFSVDPRIVQNGSFYLEPAYKSGMFRLSEPVITKAGLDSCFRVNRNKAIDAGVFKEDWKVTISVDQNRTDTVTYFNLDSSSLPPQHSLFEDRFLVLRDTTVNSIFLMAATPKIEGKKKMMLTGNYYKNGFHTWMRNNDLPPGRYDLGILTDTEEGGKEFFMLEKSLTVSDEYLTLQP